MDKFYFLRILTIIPNTNVMIKKLLIRKQTFKKIENYENNVQNELLIKSGSKFITFYRAYNNAYFNEC